MAARERGQDMPGLIALLVDDRALLSSLQFALSIEGFELAAEGNPAADALVIDQSYHGNGLAKLLAMRGQGHTSRAVILATHPTASFRVRAASAGALVIEKPLLGDDLSSAISSLLQSRKAA